MYRTKMHEDQQTIVKQSHVVMRTPDLSLAN